MQQAILSEQGNWKVTVLYADIKFFVALLVAMTVCWSWVKFNTERGDPAAVLLHFSMRALLKRSFFFQKR